MPTNCDAISMGTIESMVVPSVHSEEPTIALIIIIVPLMPKVQMSIIIRA